MHDIHQYRIVNKLKEVMRKSSVGTRKESSAEHSWGTLILADYFLAFEKDLNREKVFEMLIYHDLVEIETGDAGLDEEEKREGQKERELAGMEKLAEKLPTTIREKFIRSFTEFLELETREAQFCKAIDRLEGTLQEMDYKEDWKGWSEAFLREKTEKYYHEFPSIKETFEELIKYANEEGFFTQK